MFDLETLLKVWREVPFSHAKDEKQNLKEKINENYCILIRLKLIEKSYLDKIKSCHRKLVSLLRFGLGKPQRQITLEFSSGLLESLRFSIRGSSKVLAVSTVIALSEEEWLVAGHGISHL